MSTLRTGAYEFRALVADSAGNERSTTIDVSGHAAVRQVPARVNTDSSSVSCGAPGRRSRRIIVHPVIGYGRPVALSGRLATPGANPVADADIEVVAAGALPGSPVDASSLCQDGSSTDASVQGAEGSRVGSSGSATRARGIVRARTSQVDARRAGQDDAPQQPQPGRQRRGRHAPRTCARRSVPERSASSCSFRRSRAVSGSRSPRRGQIRLPGAGVTTTDSRATRGTVRYRFRARVPRESGFPYTAGTSRYVYVTVQRPLTTMRNFAAHRPMVMR